MGEVAGEILRWIVSLKHPERLIFLGSARA